ncbi:hypothetical protein, partial [Maritimibacter sp. 55A14]|uniref:hypothetical protein n=1 Tax=Maritimibacter sp. 55A14 TaxID=2174844 RepID=UPI001E406B5F
GRSRLSYLMAPRLRPLLMPPNDGTQKGNKLDLRVALKKGAGHSRRAIQNPELRLMARSMWNELRRGLAAVDFDRLEEGVRIGRIPSDLSDQLTFVPQGLEPEVS